MRTRTLAAILGSGVGALGLAALGAILWLDGGPVGPGGAPAQPSEPPAVPAPPPRPPPAPVPAPPAVPRLEPQPTDPAEDPTWQRLPATTTFRTLGPIGRDLRVGARRARLEATRCYRDVPDDAPAGSRPPVLELLLESRPGELEVVGVRVARAGASPPGQVECIRGILAGFRVPSSSAVAGQRFKVRLPRDP